MPAAAIRSMQKRRKSKSLKTTNALEFAGLEKFLKEVPMLEDEKAMWRHLGFCITGPDVYIDSSGKRSMGGSNTCCIIDHMGIRDNLNSTIGFNLKNMFMISWQEGSPVHGKKEDDFEDLEESLQQRRIG